MFKLVLGIACVFALVHLSAQMPTIRGADLADGYPTHLQNSAKNSEELSPRQLNHQARVGRVLGNIQRDHQRSVKVTITQPNQVINILGQLKESIERADFVDVYGEANQREKKMMECIMREQLEGIPCDEYKKKK